MLFVSDIDGTLLDPKRELSVRTTEAIRHVRSLGHNFVLCSSRMPRSMHQLQQQYSADPQWTLAYNGAFVTAPDDIVHIDTAMSVASARSTYQRATKLGLHVSLYAANSWFSSGSDQWEAREANNTRVQPCTTDAASYIESGLVDELAPHKIMAMGLAEDIDKLERITAQNPDLVTYRAKQTYLEIASIRTSKGAALCMLARATNTPLSDVVYFGDGHNDVSALKVAGTGVAVANAVPAAKEAADRTTLTGKDDGVAAILEEMMSKTSMLGRLALEQGRAEPK